jgi:hypothetical protein
MQLSCRRRQQRRRRILRLERRTSAAEPATRLVAIEQLQVRQRVRADAPTDELDLQFGSEVVSEHWRKLTLLAPKRDGSTADVVLLRPLTWLNNKRPKSAGRCSFPYRNAALMGMLRCWQLSRVRRFCLAMAESSRGPYGKRRISGRCPFQDTCDVSKIDHSLSTLVSHARYRIWY